MKRSLVIPCEPFPQARPRLHRSGFAYDPTKEKKKALSYLIASEWDQNPISVGIKLTVIFYMKIPKSASKKKRAELDGKPHITRFDIDNGLKALLDSMNGIVFNDDALIHTLNAKKFHSNDPRIEFEVDY